MALIFKGTLIVLGLYPVVEERRGRLGRAHLTSAEVLFICSEPCCAADGLGGVRDPGVAWKHAWVLRLARWDSGDRRDGIRQRYLLVVLADVDYGALGEAEVSAKVVDALHPSFTGII